MKYYFFCPHIFWFEFSCFSNDIFLDCIIHGHRQQGKKQPLKLQLHDMVKSKGVHLDLNLDTQA